jgi:pilus assembly protein FimV
MGRLVVQSSLGEPLRAEIEINSLSSDEAANLKVRVARPEAYRAAGVDYNAVLPSTKATLQRRSDGRPYLRLTSDLVVQEPFVDVMLELTWNSGQLVREYTLLFDPPTMQAQAPTPSTPPVIAATPAYAEPRIPSGAPGTAAAPSQSNRRDTGEAGVQARRPRPAPADVPLLEPRKAPATTAQAAASEYRVKPGDTLSGIAGRKQPPGVSLDQMLVAIFNANPPAFIGGNVNRLKAGAVLAIPDSETAKVTSADEAHQVIQAQSSDFAAYRQRLAGLAAPVVSEESTRRAGGKVQAEVDDRKQGPAPAPDKLTLSKGSAKVVAAEERVSKEREAKDASARAAELKKSVDELQKLSAAAKPGAVVPTAPAPAPASAPKLVPAPTAPVESAASAATPVATAQAVAAPASSVAPAAASAPLAAIPASAAVLSAAPAASAAPTDAQASAAAPKEPAPAPALTRPSARPHEEPGLLDALTENPLILAGVGLVLAVLAGLGGYRYFKRTRKDAGETSFLESRLQPDSFFGISGGQHIDTRESGATSSSSMSYSLSQIDAGGDVDPVAEADVYLAYGRDLQAEEILKEALRANPERMATRSKLLEVYAKRRDSKAFEQLAAQMRGLTRGEGEEWAKVMELGAQIDPDNPLYKVGGGVAAPVRASGQKTVLEDDLSTMPQSMLTAQSGFDEATAGISTQEHTSSDFVDLELDLESRPAASTRPGSATTARSQAAGPMFELPSAAQKPPAAPSPPVPTPSQTVDFDISDFSLDAAEPSAPAPLQVPSDLGSLDLGEGGDDGEDGADPFERKLELADEFRQIGDTEGARDLLQEVIAQTGGAIQAKARAMLESLT